MDSLATIADVVVLPVPGVPVITMILPLSIYFYPFNSDLSLCIGKDYSIPKQEKQSAKSPVPPIQTVKGQVVFFRKGREKISTLKPLTVWIFDAAVSWLPEEKRERLIITATETCRWQSAPLARLCGGDLQRNALSGE